MARDLSAHCDRWCSGDALINWQGIFAGAFTAVTAILIIVCLTTIIEKLLNPEFQALDYFLSFVKQDTTE